MRLTEDEAQHLLELDKWTDRQRQVFNLMAEGLTQAQVARRLGLQYSRISAIWGPLKEVWLPRWLGLYRIKVALDLPRPETVQAARVARPQA